MKRVRAARHYQSPDAPLRRLADAGIRPIARALKTTLTVAARLFDTEKAEYLLQNGRYREVAGIINWAHADEAMRRPLTMLGVLWQEAGELGERKLNGSFRAHRRVVRFKKQNAHPEERQGAGALSVDARRGTASTTGILDHESVLASLVVAKDQADLFNYDRFDPVTQAHIRSFQDALIVQLGVDARATIEETILAGLRAGRTPAEMVAQIRAVIGLTDRQAAAVLRFRQMLMENNPQALTRSLFSVRDKAAFYEAVGSGKILSMATIDDMVERYRDNYLDHRALTIATTEATRAASLGLQDSYLQAVNRGVLPSAAVRQYWQLDLDERTCDHCISVVDMNPDGVELGEPFQSDHGPVDGPGLHPNCRCSIELVTNLDLVPDDYDG